MGDTQALEQTLALIKPDAVEHRGEIEILIKATGLKIITLVECRLTIEDVETLYAEHVDKSFFPPHCDFMTSGAIAVLILEGENAVARYRELMGATDPKEAEPHTLRGRFGSTLPRNAVHGSDSADTAAAEINFFEARFHFTV